MECLCAHPPPRLQHLGLGHNKLLGPLESLYVTADHWPNLVSLDLSFNDLTDLQGMIASLSTLQHLRLLVLQGNPLGLVPYYRGFTIDSLPRLCVLDDITVSPSEKYQFRGLSHHGDLLACEAQLVVTIGNVKGVPDTSILDPDPGPQGPFISYSYYVTYGFVEDEEGEGSKYGGVLAEAKPRVSSSQENGGTPAPAEIVPPNVDLSGGARRAFKTTAQKPPCFPPGAQAPAPARARCAEDPERRPRGARVSPADRQALGARRAAGPGRPRGALRGARRLRRVGPVLAVGGAGGLAGLGRVGGPALGDGLGGGAGGAGAAAAARGSPAPPLPGVRAAGAGAGRGRNNITEPLKTPQAPPSFPRVIINSGDTISHRASLRPLYKWHRAVILGLASWHAVHIFSKALSSSLATASRVMVPCLPLPSPRTVLFSTTHKPWTDVIPCNYEMQHSLRDLVPLKAFLLAGTTVTIVEEKILSWPLVPPPVDIVSPAKKGKGEKDKKGKKDKDKEKDGNDKAGKGEKGKAKEQKAAKKKELPKELRQDPPILSVLGSGLLALEPLLAGEPLVSSVCNFGVIRTPEIDRLMFLRDLKKNKKAKNEKKKSALAISESDYQPQPLTVEVQVQLSQCRSAEEALRDFAL
ncbi:leucine-rich repeat-containing protein 43 [Vulpes vulpes]|uniref:Leucine-rich repeat-containing protein 43 n=1 Tax=Vulpes vulpes TaxID=9627 RepID=A0ABM4XTI3_VULVU